MTNPNLPESEATVRAWLKWRFPDHQRWYFAVPQSDEPQLPFAVHYRVGGRPDRFGHDNPFVTIEVYGSNKHETSTLATNMASSIVAYEHEQPVVLSGVIYKSARLVIGPRPMPPKPLKGYRYELGMVFQVCSELS